MNFSVGDIVQMKKQHPCGSNEWGSAEGRNGFQNKVLRMRTYGYASED